MAKKIDRAAAKQRQQKIILVAGAVLLAAVLAFQGPKLLKHGKGSSTATPATTSTSTDSATTNDSSTGTAVPAVAAGPGTAQLAGVVLKPAAPPVAQTGQLWSLSRFKPKDPFVQQVKVDSATTGVATVTGSPKPAAGGAKSGPVAIGGIGGGTAVAGNPPAAPPAYATVMVNGAPQQLGLKQVFPKREPTFVLLAVGRGFVKIGVAGGQFTDGKAIKIELGKPVTLMNTATARRFVMRLVYTGPQPEQIAGFKAPAPADTRLTAGATKP